MSEKQDESKLKEAVMAPFDLIYRAVNGALECPYCTFYRGVAAGVFVGALIGLKMGRGEPK